MAKKTAAKSDLQEWARGFALLSDPTRLGILAMLAPFWQTEAICRKAIEQVGLGFRMRKVGKHGT